jgi:hypothetical protein
MSRIPFGLERPLSGRRLYSDNILALRRRGETRHYEPPPLKEPTEAISSKIAQRQEKFQAKKSAQVGAFI